MRGEAGAVGATPGIRNGMTWEVPRVCSQRTRAREVLEKRQLTSSFCQSVGRSRGSCVRKHSGNVSERATRWIWHGRRAGDQPSIPFTPTREIYRANLVPLSLLKFAKTEDESCNGKTDAPLPRTEVEALLLAAFRVSDTETVADGLEMR